MSMDSIRRAVAHRSVSVVPGLLAGCLLASPASGAALLSGPESHGGHVYYLVEQSSWQAAEDLAVSMGGHLVTIDDAAEDAFVFSTFSTQVGSGGRRSLWTGLNDQAVEGTFVWASGDPYVPGTSYQNFAAGEPRGQFPGEDFIGISVNLPEFTAGTWHDINQPSGDITFGVIEVPTASILSSPNVFGGHTYYLTAQSSWQDAEDLAVAMGGHLVTIDDAAEDSFVFNTLSPLVAGAGRRSLWTGLNDQTLEGTYEWVSGDPFVPGSSYDNFAAGEPRAQFGDEDFIGISVNLPEFGPGEWHDIRLSGSDVTFGIIEVPRVVPITSMPEPSTLVLLGCGLGGLVLQGRRRGSFAG